MKIVEVDSIISEDLENETMIFRIRTDTGKIVIATTLKELRETILKKIAELECDDEGFEKLILFFNSMGMKETK